MIARLARLRKHPSVFRHLTGLTTAAFDALERFRGWCSASGLPAVG